MGVFELDKLPLRLQRKILRKQGGKRLHGTHGRAWDDPPCYR